MAETPKGGAAKRTPAPTPPKEAEKPQAADLPVVEVPEGTAPYTVAVKLDGSEDPGSITVFVPEDTDEADVEAFIELELGEQSIDKDRIIGFEKVLDAEVEENTTPPAGEGVPKDETPAPTPEDEEAARLAALEKLANGTDDEDSAVTEPEPVVVAPNGNVIDLSDSGKSAEYLVLKSLFTIRVHGNFRVARKGDTVRLSRDQAKRGLDTESLEKV